MIGTPLGLLLLDNAIRGAVPDVIGAPLTPAEIADGLAGRYGPVSMEWRYERRSLTYQFRDDITQAIYADPTLTLDNGRAVLRDLSGLELDKDALPADFDATQDNIAVTEVRKVRPPGREEPVEVLFPLGLFRLDVGRERSYDGRPTVIEASASDLGWLLTTSGPSATYTVAKDTSYRSACETVLSALGLAHSLDVTGYALPVDVTWPAWPETTWYTVLRDLSDGINYHTPWPDSRGRFRWAAKVTNPVVQLPAETYGDSGEPLMIDGDAPWEREHNAAALPNACVVVIDAPGHPGFGFVRRDNADPASPISTATRPERVVELDSDSTPSTKAIHSAELAAAVSETTLREAASSYETARLETFPDPRRGAHEYIAVQVNSQSAALYEVTRWSRPLTVGGRMTHELRLASSPTLTTPVVP